MLPKSINFLLIILVFSTLATGARRKSKVDSPIQLAADAPLTDNIATASGSEPQVIKEAAPLAATDKPSPSSTPGAAAAAAAVPAAASSLANIDNDDLCDTDMIGFEIITG